MSTQSPWWKNASIYQIYPSSFKDSNDDGIGDIPGIISELDYIQSLGVDAIWLCPMYDSPQYDMGYDISNYEAVYAPYGTVEDMETLIEACHTRGLRLLLDLVINHTSSHHAWFRESRSSKSNPKRDWYIWKPARYDEVTGQRRPPNNWRSFFEGSAWEWDEDTQEYYLHLFAVQQPDLNWENPETRAAIYESAMEFWLRKGVDGFRVDTVNMYSKDPSYRDAQVVDHTVEWQDGASLFCNGPRIHEYMREMGQILRKYDAMTVGELPYTTDVADVLAYVSEREQQLSMVLQFEVVNVGIGEDHKYNTTPRNWTLPDLKEQVRFTQSLMQGTDGWSTTFLENHDQARSVSRWGCTDTPELWNKSAKLLAIVVASLSGTLYVYQGQEIAMINAPAEWPIDEFKDIESTNYYERIRKHSNGDPVALDRAKKAIDHLARDHARLPMQWDSTAYAGFTSASSVQPPWMRVHDNYASLNVQRQESDPDSVLQFWRQLLRVRKAHPKVFAQGGFVDTDPKHESLFIFEKVAADNQKKLVVVLNFTAEKQPMTDLVKYLGDEGSWSTLIKNYETESLDELQPYEGRVYLVT